MKTILSALAFLALSALPALAGDATEPVKFIMDRVVTNWSPEADGPNSKWKDYFDKEDLERIYAKDFVAAYREAQKFPAFDEGDSPFDYDVMTDSQDGCPLEDLKIAEAGPAKGGTEVVATYKFFACGGFEGDADRLTTLKFIVIEEGGAMKIADVIRDREDGASLLQEMKDIAANGKG